MQTAQPNIFAQSRLPLDVLAIILDNVEGLEDCHRDNATLRSLMLCNKSLHSLALPRLFSHVKLSGIAHFAYALHLQSSANSPLLVKSLQLDWSIEGRYSEGCSQSTNDSLISIVLAMCPSLTDLKLVWGEAQMTQDDVDALDEFLPSRLSSTASPSTLTENAITNLAMLRKDSRP